MLEHLYTSHQLNVVYELIKHVLSELTGEDWKIFVIIVLSGKTNTQRLIRTGLYSSNIFFPRKRAYINTWWQQWHNLMPDDLDDTLDKIVAFLNVRMLLIVWTACAFWVHYSHQHCLLLKQSEDLKLTFGKLWCGAGLRWARGLKPQAPLVEGPHVRPFINSHFRTHK